MNPIQLLGIIQRAHHLDKDDVTELLKLHETFPYFQIPKVLLAKFEYKKAGRSENEILPWAAITSPDRAWLKKLIETDQLFEEQSPALSKRLQELEEKKKIEEGKNFIDDLEGHLIPETKKSTTTKDLTATLKKLGEDLAQSKLKALEKLDGLSKKTESKVEPTESPSPVPQVESVKEVSEELKVEAKTGETNNEVTTKPKRRNHHKDELIESIRKKEKKEILDKKKLEQIDIIKAFSKKEIKLATLKEIEDIQKQDDLSEKSTKLNPSLITESYARILTKQGKKERAKEIYKKLMVKFPDKNTYFADLIKELEEIKD
ncbi:hypothetical protein [Cecembia calidifontis]|uniref:Tetratricopeptide repeat protein n=1 Tax=Cecembia calidifontis TaxID=1187080 RepID=A0A4Q7PCF5_9BACT|nr:hypothetical protein [Cecembia calidifontis]RZS98043.1 hypothetical protein BC751_3675 [Cecembia calidifontis]